MNKKNEGPLTAVPNADRVHQPNGHERGTVKRVESDKIHTASQHRGRGCKPHSIEPAPLPSWMSDPAQLPKRPPGKS